MKKILIVVLLVAAVGFTGCDEDVTTPTPVATNYFPMTQGSNWTYDVTSVEVTEEGEDTTVTKQQTKAVSGDTTINGRKYFRVISTDLEDSNEFFRRGNDTVFTLGEDGSEAIISIERKGVTWTISETSEFGSGTTVFTVMDKGISRSVSGKSYNDVLHLRAVTNGTIFGVPFQITQHAYLANGVGMIEETDDMGGNSKLKSYTIK